MRHDKRKKMAESLVATLQEEKPTEWTDDEVNEHIRTRGHFLSHVINYRLSRGRLLPIASTAPATGIPTPASIAIGHLKNPQTPIPFQPQDPPPIGLVPATPGTVPPATPVPTPSAMPPHVPTPNPVPQSIDPVPQPPDLLPPPQHAPVPQPARAQGYGKELANMAKMYTEEAKYSSDSDSFDFKLMIFNNICS